MARKYTSRPKRPSVTFDEAVRILGDHFGSKKELARRLNTPSQAVSRWIAKQFRSERYLLEAETMFREEGWI